MRCLTIVLITALFWWAVVAQVPPPAEIALVGGRIYVAPTLPAIADGVVIVRNGKITILPMNMCKSGMPG